MALWKVLDPPNDATLLIRDILILLSAIHNLCVLVYHCYHTLECFTKSKPKTVQSLSILVLILIALYTVHGIFHAWLKFNGLNDILWCKWMVITSSLLWTYSKIAMYWLFLERLFISFKGSPFTKFTPSQILLSRAILTTYFIFISILGLLTCDAKIVNNACYANLPGHLFIIAGIADMSFSTVIAILFSRRLLLLNFEMIELNLKQSSNELEKDDSDDSLSKLLRKFTILSFVALFTTQFSLIIMLIIGIPFIWASTDSMVNAWCIILVFAIHTKIYSNICQRLEVLMSNKFLICFSLHHCWKIKKEKNKETKSDQESDENVNHRELQTSETSSV